ncbi:hypothetical protein TI39_contig4224g00009 [Zymoseptoria brevis]|uniref:Protein kinase domain-containing protein n=1 Tax=Zymoseptoria brevis TaxID=1047168 RepID=A0A0F4G9M3_9PEZI|nr:hypothetical protein TI39_contig4224g00009 [Zymoseptoria brevis]
MEFVERGDLQQFVGLPMPEDEMQLIVSQVLEGLSHMHNLNYAHRDLKAAGILIDDAEDSDDQSRPSYTNAFDIWALGVITYQLLGTQLPFPAGDLRPLKSTAGIAWVQSCLAPAPVRRPSAGFSRGLRWPLGATSDTETARQLRRPTAYASVASASWGAQDSGYETTLPDPPTDPPQDLTQPAQADNGIPDFVRVTSDHLDPVVGDCPMDSFKAPIKFKDAIGQEFSFPSSISAKPGGAWKR